MASVSTALLLLWQFSSRLARTLADMRAANTALRESELRYRSIYGDHRRRDLLAAHRR